MIFVPLIHPVFDSVSFLHDFRSSVPRTPAAALPSLGFCSRSSAAVRQHQQRASRAPARASFLLFSDIPRTLSKFLEIPDLFVPHTRVNFSTASSTTIPHPVEGAALLCGRLPPSFSVSPFRPGNLGLFGALLQPPAPKKLVKIRENSAKFWQNLRILGKKKQQKFQQFFTKILRLESGPFR